MGPKWIVACLTTCVVTLLICFVQSRTATKIARQLKDQGRTQESVTRRLEDLQRSLDKLSGLAGRVEQLAVSVDNVDTLSRSLSDRIGMLESAVTEMCSPEADEPVRVPLVDVAGVDVDPPSARVAEHSEDITSAAISDLERRYSFVTLEDLPESRQKGWAAYAGKGVFLHEPGSDNYGVGYVTRIPGGLEPVTAENKELLMRMLGLYSDHRTAADDVAQRLVDQGRCERFDSLEESTAYREKNGGKNFRFRMDGDQYAVLDSKLIKADPLVVELQRQIDEIGRELLAGRGGGWGSRWSGTPSP